MRKHDAERYRKSPEKTSDRVQSRTLSLSEDRRPTAYQANSPGNRYQRSEDAGDSFDKRYHQNYSPGYTDNGHHQSSSQKRQKQPKEKRDHDSGYPKTRHRDEFSSRKRMVEGNYYYPKTDPQTTYQSNYQGNSYQRGEDERESQKKEKTFFQKGKDMANAFLGNFHDSTSVTLHHNRVNIVAAEHKNPSWQEDLKCSQLKLMQPDEPIDEYISNVTLQWSLPTSEFCELTGLIVMVRDDCGTQYQKSIGCNISNVVIPSYKLRCGKKYYAYIVSVIKHYYEEEQKQSSEETTFFTRPGRPNVIGVTCNERHAEVQWSPCSGAEKFEINIFKNYRGKALDHKVTDGSQHKCKFEFDNRGSIRLGEKYYVEVISIREDWMNHSIQDKHFFGSKNSPKSVVAELIAENNTVRLKWDPPRRSFLPFSYIVQVVPESGDPRELLPTTKTSHNVDDLKGGMVYSFWVATIDGDKARSIWSTSDTIKTKACTIKVEKLRLEQNKDKPDRCLDCVWNSVKGALSYKIKYKCRDRASVVKIDKDATNYIISDLLPNTEYQAYIKAEDGRGFGPYTEEEKKRTAMSKPKNPMIEVIEGNTIKIGYVEAQLATMHKISLFDNEGNERVANVKPGLAPKPFRDLDHNMQYHSTIISLYESKEGGQIRTEKVLTAPRAPCARDILCEPDEENITSAFDLFIKLQNNCIKYQAQIACLDDGSEIKTMQMAIDEENERATLRYKCYNEGSKYSVKVRAKNSGGYSFWSDPKFVLTAPRKICNLVVNLENEQLKVEWSNVHNSRNNTLKIFEEGELIKTVRPRDSPYIFREELEHGVEYNCEIYPENDTGHGPTTKSNTILMTLDPPQNLVMRDERTAARFEWQSSRGMRAAQISFADSDFQETTDLTRKTGWLSPPVAHGEVYEFKIWARNGKACSETCLSKTYVTAPSKVNVTRNTLRPETSLDVQILTNYTGPFLLTWCNEDEGSSVGIFENSYTIDDLKPATQYSISALCCYGETGTIKSARCHGNPIMTLPAQVSGVRCENGEDSFKRLAWNGCGNDMVEYTIAWSRNHVHFKPITTENTYWEFLDLQAGSYEFLVSAGGGKSSEPCFVMIPDAPKMEVEVLSYEKIRVTFKSSGLAQTHCLLLKSAGFSQTFETDFDECEYEIGKDAFIFEKGVKYTIVGRAKWKDHCSLPTTMQFVTGLENPSNFTCELAHSDPQRPMMISWENSPGMFNAKIQLRDFSNKILADEITSNTWWDYWGLEPNNKYDLILWPGDGRRIYQDNRTRHTFVTAPSPPSRALFWRHVSPPYTRGEVEITSEYSGPFLISITDMSGREFRPPWEEKKKKFYIGNLKRNTTYEVSVQCKFGDYVTLKTIATGPGVHNGHTARKRFPSENSDDLSNQKTSNISLSPRKDGAVATISRRRRTGSQIRSGHPLSVGSGLARRARDTSRRGHATISKRR